MSDETVLFSLPLVRLEPIFKNWVRDCLNEKNNATASTTEQEKPHILYSLQALADFLGCSIVTAQRLKNSGRIPYRQFGRKLIFNTHDVMEALKKKGKSV
ncbi:MAG: DUF3853 family protein [Bacteroidia bacterium]|nr:DUF3853 family protein [Bacteroidia bacterium]